MIKYTLYYIYYIFYYFSSFLKKDIYNSYKNSYKSYKCHFCFSRIKTGEIYFAMDKEFCTYICRENYLCYNIL
jgi:hypothetical protein